MAQIPILLVTPLYGVFWSIVSTGKNTDPDPIFIYGTSPFHGYVTFERRDRRLWHILILSPLIGCTNARTIPPVKLFYPSLVAKEHLSNAIAPNSAVINGSRLIGPAVGGVLIGIFGEGLCFLLNGISYPSQYRPLPDAPATFTVQHRRQNVLHRYTRRFLPMCPVTFPYGPCCC